MEQITFAVSWWQVAGALGGIALTVSGGVFALMRWSIVRNIQALDARFDTLEERMEKTSARLDTLYQRQESLVREATTKQECSACRRDCQDRLSQYQREILEWMRRQDDKMDRLLMMSANQHNGLGGVKNGLGG